MATPWAKNYPGTSSSPLIFEDVMIVDTYGTVIASSSAREVGKSLFARFDDTRVKFEQTLHRAPGYVYISDLNEIPGSPPSGVRRN